MIKLSDLHPDVLKLYEGLINGKYADCDDYLVSPVEEYETSSQCFEPRELNRTEVEMFFEGQKINDYFESDNIEYGL